MSDLAPFVAATLRDKVVLELQEDNEKLRNENQRLQDEGGSWTIEITGSTGFPVYAVGKISQRQVLIKKLGENVHPTSNVGVEMHGEAGVACRFDRFLECKVIVTNSLGHKIIEIVDGPFSDIGNGIRAHRGRLEVGWHLCFGNEGDTKVAVDIYFDMPIPPSKLDTLNPDLVAGLAINREEAFLIAEDVVGNDAPIRFKSIYLDIKNLIAI